MTTHDFTYLDQLNVTDLLDHARRAGFENHMVRALADRLDEYADAYDTVNSLEVELADLEVELADAEQRASMWREEAQAIQRQLDMVRG